MLDLDMSPYAAFVWPAYGLTALIFVAMIWFCLAQSRHWRRRAEKDDK